MEKYATFNYQNKIEELKEYVRKNTGLVVHINTTQYPVVISFFKGGAAQTSIFDSDDDDEKEKVPGLQFIFYDKMQIKTQDDFGVSEEVFNKLKTLAKEVNRLYLNAFCEQVREVLEKTTPEAIKDALKGNGVKKLFSWERKKLDYKGNEYFFAVVEPDTLASFICATVNEVGEVAESLFGGA